MSNVPNHSLASGQSLQQRWGTLGAGSGRMTNQSPQGAISMLIGGGGSGKTTLLSSNPDCLIINCDTHSAPVQNVRAGVWPIKSATGELVDAGGRPLGDVTGADGKTLSGFSWEMTEEKMLKPLVALSKTTGPRPRVVAFDTVPLAARMIQDYLVRRGGKASWKDLHGPNAWDDLFNTFITWGLVLNRSGYGVIYNVHVRDQVVKLTEEQSIVSPVLSITDKFFGRFHPVCEFIAHVYKGQETFMVPDARFPGTTKTRAEQRPVSYLSTTTPGKIGDLLKSRYPLEKVVLSRDNGWQDLMAAWALAEAAANPSSGAPTSAPTPTPSPA